MNAKITIAKRFVSMLLVISMIMSLLPVSALALIDSDESVGFRAVVTEDTYKDYFKSPILATITHGASSEANWKTEAPPFVSWKSA